MISIKKPAGSDAHVLSELAKQTFIESHGDSAGPEDIGSYIREKYNPPILEKELNDPANIYHFIYFNNRLAGYSKIILNSPYAGSKKENIAKLERIYLLKEFYNLNLGAELLQFNIRLIKESGQQGIWLYTWKENQRAVRFYIKNGFIIIGEYDFQISATHTNPNYIMLLEF